MADEPNNNTVDVDFLMQRLGMTRDLAEQTVEATSGDPDHVVRTEEWLRQVPREELLDLGVEPFAADRIAYFQSLFPSHNDDDNQETNSGNNNGLVNGGILLGGAALGATQATAVGTAGLAAAGFTSTGVAAGSVAAAIQGPATAAGSWFALCQSAGATGAIAGPVGIAAGVAAAAIGLGVAAAVVHFKNKHDAEQATTNAGDAQESEKKLPPTANNEPIALTVDFLRAGIPDLTMDLATRLLERFNAIHVFTIHDFLIVSRATMEEMFDDVLLQYLETIALYQEDLCLNLRN
jgi:hypothetical protein